MRILLSTYGSRGDVEPLAGLAASLQGLGAEVVVSAPGDQEFVDVLARAGVEMAPTFMPVRQWIREKAKPSAPADFARLATEMIAGEYQAIGAAAPGCDAIVATGLFPSAAAAQCVAEKRAIPYFHASFCPLFLPSHHHQPFTYPGDPYPPEVTDPRALWDLNAEAMAARFGEPVNAHRTSIGLPALKNVRDHVFTSRPLLAADPILWPWHETDLCDAVPTGAWILPDKRPLAADLEAFLAAGDAPVYVGFGSISLQSTRDAAQIAIQAVRAQGRRLVLARGWADNAPPDDRDDCFVVADVNQQALFPRMAAVVHHGGAGTTTTAARAGTPQVIVPQIVDQPYWAERVATLGIGVAHPGPTPTFETLSAALDTALAPETQARARHVAGMMPGDGAAVAARFLLATLLQASQQTV